MKQIKYFLLMLVMACSLTSCVSAYAMYDTQDEMYTTTDVTYMTVVTYGAPYYYDGVISYYLYNGWYYYPYWWNDCWYFYPHRHVQHLGYRYHPRHHHKPHMHLGDTHHHHKNPNFGNHSVTPRNKPTRSCNWQDRSSTRITANRPSQPNKTDIQKVLPRGSFSPTTRTPQTTPRVQQTTPRFQGTPRVQQSAPRMQSAPRIQQSTPRSSGNVTRGNISRGR